MGAGGNSVGTVGNTIIKRKGRLAGQAAIDSLNEDVLRKTLAAREHAATTGTPLPIAFEAVGRPMSVGGIWAGAPIYVSRSVVPAVVATIVGAGCLVDGASTIGVKATLASLVVIFLGYDFYSGVLHVVLDEPKNIAVPIIGQPALEFQWHHFIPSDIARKDFKDVIGDLCLAVVVVCTIQLYVACDMGRDKLGLTLMSLKLFMAYFGQYSHRSAHDIRVGRVGKFLQKTGLIISIKNHKAHHVAPHDDDFCLIGVCNPIIQQMRRVTTGQKSWLAIFLFFSVFDIKLMTMAMRAVVPSL